MRLERARFMTALAALWLLLLPLAAGPGRAEGLTLRYQMGGGNIVTHLPVSAPTSTLLEALQRMGARLGRMNSYGWRTDARVPTMKDFDKAMMEAYRHGVTPVILLEYEGSYQTLDPPQPIGSYEDWFRAGVEVARRFRPNGDWGQEHGIKDFGATIFTATNEPDVQNTIPKKAYHDSLAGLADGVHSIDPSLKVVPGGFAACNIDGDATLRGYGPAIADLLESGKLDGIDLHTYYNSKWFPLTEGRYFSAQSCFDRVKQAMGLKRDIRFYSTEYNISRSFAWQEDEMLGKLFFTALWDNLGVVGVDGKSATVFAFPWTLADNGRFGGPAYAMAESESPWLPDVRAKVMQRVLSVAGDMEIVESDPLKSGTLHLSGKEADLFVWHNRRDWTDRLGSTWTVALPDWARQAELWGWDGLRETRLVSGGSVTFENLAEGETYMVRVAR